MSSWDVDQIRIPPAILCHTLKPKRSWRCQICLYWQHRRLSHDNLRCCQWRQSLPHDDLGDSPYSWWCPVVPVSVRDGEAGQGYGRGWEHHRPQDRGHHGSCGPGVCREGRRGGPDTYLRGWYIRKCPREKIATILTTTFSNLLWCMGIAMVWHWNLCPRIKLTKIGSDNGLAPNRRQTVVCTNDGLVYWIIYMSRGIDELIN